MGQTIEMYEKSEEFLSQWKCFKNHEYYLKKFETKKAEILKIEMNYFYKIAEEIFDESNSTKEILKGYRLWIRDLIRENVSYKVATHLLATCQRATEEISNHYIQKYILNTKNPDKFEKFEVTKNGKQFKFVNGRLIEIKD